ncbi:YggT family protein [Fibrobacterota bacterium]
MIRTLLDWSANLYIVILIGRWVIETFITQYQNTGWFLKIKDITEPVLEAIRKLVPPYKGIDFSYLIAIIGVKVVVKLLIAIL